MKLRVNLIVLLVVGIMADELQRHRKHRPAARCHRNPHAEKPRTYTDTGTHTWRAGVYQRGLPAGNRISTMGNIT